MMTFRYAALGLAFTSLLAGCTNLAALDENLAQVDYRQADLSYRLLRDETRVRFKVGPTRGRFRVADARLSFPRPHLDAGVLEVTLATASVDVLNPVVEQMLKGQEWFDSDSYPLAYFKSAEGALAAADENTSISVNGTLQIKTVTRPLLLNVTFPDGMPDLNNPPGRFNFTAQGSFSRASYEMDALPGMAPDEVNVTVDGVFELIL